MKRHSDAIRMDVDMEGDAKDGKDANIQSLLFEQVELQYGSVYRGSDKPLPFELCTCHGMLLSEGPLVKLSHAPEEAAGTKRFGMPAQSH